MRIFILISLLVVIASPLKSQDSIPKPSKEANIKVTLLTMGSSLSSGLFIRNPDVRNYSLEFEKYIGKKQTITVAPTYRFYKDRNTSSTTQYRGDFVELGLGYNYYLLQQSEENPFKGIYIGSSLFGGLSTTKSTVSGRTTTSKAEMLGLSIRLGTQTSLFKVLTISIEGAYRADQYYTDDLTIGYGYLMSVLRLGIAF